MKKTMKKLLNFIIVISVLMTAVIAHADPMDDIKDKIDKDKDVLAGLTDELMELQDAQDLLEETISDLDSELLNTMACIGVLEEDIQAKAADIAETQLQYEAAKAEEEAQYDAMVSRIQLMYEMGEADYLSALFSVESFSELLNQASYIEAIYSYDQKMLETYVETKDQVKLFWDELEAEKAALEKDKADLEAQTDYLDGLLTQKKKESANFDTQIARAKQEANVLKAKIKQEQAELKKLQDEEQRKNAANGSYTVSTSVAEIINAASGSDLGKQIARYGCQFIGNPYVMGGTSLTNGTDCSGFTYSIYKHFGYVIPRTSYNQRSAGTEVKYADAQPGDLICYDGHVAMYIGGGYIVHASSAKTGIKVSKATYRTILSVRRII